MVLISWIKSHYKLASGVLVAAVLIVFTVVYASNYQRSCNFVISDLQEYKGEYKSIYDFLKSDYYIVYEGAIRNNSDKDEFLNGMVAKVYNTENVLVSDGYTEINEVVKAHTAVPFKIHTGINYRNDTVIRKYFDINSDFNPDVYPWFSTCK